jgi:predicted HTH domain antitoxin
LVLNNKINLGIVYLGKKINFGIMRVVTLNIPENINLNSVDLAMIVASRLYEQGSLSLGQAAEMAGLTKRSFAELLGKFGVSIFNYPVSDISRDIANA